MVLTIACMGTEIIITLIYQWHWESISEKGAQIFTDEDQFTC